MENDKATLSELARKYGLEKQSVKTALEAAGIKWIPGKNRSHLYDAAAADRVLRAQRDVMALIREQRLGMMTAQRELAEQRRDDYRAIHITVEDHFFILKHVCAAVHRWLYRLELPFVEEVKRGHDLVQEGLEAWAAIGMPERYIEEERRELNRARKALERAIKDGVMDVGRNWMKVPSEIRMNLYVRRQDEMEEERRMLSETNGSTDATPRSAPSQ